MPCLEVQVQEKNQHSRSQAEFRKQPYSRMTWSKNDVVSHECTERQKKSEKQVELCNIKVETNGLALPDGQAHRWQTETQRCSVLYTDDFKIWSARFVCSLSVIINSQREMLDNWPYGFLVL